MNDEIKVGDVVELKSGSFKMTVTKIWNNRDFYGNNINYVNIIYCLNDVIITKNGIEYDSLKKSDPLSDKI